jgi:hypothetical protein
MARPSFVEPCAVTRTRGEVVKQTTAQSTRPKTTLLVQISRLLNDLPERPAS